VLTLFLDIARVRTHALIEGQTALAAIMIECTVVKALLFLIETRDKASILLPEYSNISIESRSSLISRAFFLWLNPLLLTGFGGVISSRNLPKIYEKLSSETLTSKVELRWKGGKWPTW
jgi:ATP-binding cassette, subfamily C (CFTR/MRP), member 1